MNKQLDPSRVDDLPSAWLDHVDAQLIDRLHGGLPLTERPYADVATDLGGEFWDEFKGVKRWQEETLKFFERHLYVETLGGNRRRGPMSPNEIINMPIQGTAAEIVCEAMCALSERSVVEDNPDIHPILNVHDDLTFDAADITLDANLSIIVAEMCKHRFDYINVPLVVEVSVGPRWSELEEIGVYRSNELFGLPNPYKRS